MEMKRYVVIFRVLPGLMRSVGTRAGLKFVASVFSVEVTSILNEKAVGNSETDIYQTEYTMSELLKTLYECVETIDKMVFPEIKSKWSSFETSGRDCLVTSRYVAEKRKKPCLDFATF
jgi:hypothetical protein